MTQIFLVRHADSVPPGPGNVDEYKRPLSPQGLDQASQLVESLESLKLDYLFSSPYLRAIQTLLPASERLGAPIEIVEDFREHALDDKPRDDWYEILSQSWADHHFALPGGEPMKVTQERGWKVLSHLASRHPGRRLALAGHGGIISLMMHRFDPTIGLDFNMSMPNPALYELRVVGERWELKADG